MAQTDEAQDIFSGLCYRHYLYSLPALPTLPNVEVLKVLVPRGSNFSARMVQVQSGAMLNAHYKNTKRPIGLATLRLLPR
jgi:hypothetical protein